VVAAWKPVPERPEQVSGELCPASATFSASVVDRTDYVSVVLPPGMKNVEAGGLGIGDDYPPRIMGVLNVSTESPYKPSVFDDPGAAAEYVDENLVGEGADIVDVGLESANKRFEVLSAEQELDRLDTAVEVLESASTDPVFSIETRYHEVAEAALSRGFDMVNDICGFADPEMPRVCEEYDAAVAKMASPPDLERPGAVEDVDDIYEALKQNGLTDKTIVDPAFGGWSEAKTLEDDRETFRRLREFRGLGHPILVSINRKNFLRDLAGRSTEAALPVSLAATSMAVERGAHVVRTHDVRETRDAALVGRAFSRRRVREAGDVAVEELDVTTTREAERHLERLGATETSVAADATVRVFEIRGLTDERYETLAAAASDAGATLVAGTDDAALLFGTPRALRKTAKSARESADTVASALETATKSTK
jgi:dihydropteroate synthase